MRLSDAGTHAVTYPAPARIAASEARHGAPVTVLPLAVGHVCDESSFGELWHHELRWALTIRIVDLPGYLGWTVTHAFPLALIAW